MLPVRSCPAPRSGAPAGGACTSGAGRAPRRTGSTAGTSDAVPWSSRLGESRPSVGPRASASVPACPALGPSRRPPGRPGPCRVRPGWRACPGWPRARCRGASCLSYRTHQREVSREPEALARERREAPLAGKRNPPSQKERQRTAHHAQVDVTELRPQRRPLRLHTAQDARHLGRIVAGPPCPERTPDASRFSRSAPEAAQRCERERLSESISGASCVSCRRHRAGLEADLEEHLTLQLEPAQAATHDAGLDRR
jgi:hypothetical protein